MTVDLRVQPLFATPIYAVDLPEAPALNRALRDAILARRRATGGVNASNIGGWQSQSDLGAWGGEAAASLERRCIAVARAVVARVGASAAEPVGWRAEMWANVNEPGHSNQTHWHPGAYLSLVYYVDDGYAGSANRSAGGELVFVDPRMPFLRMRTPDLRHRGADGSIAEQETWMRPRSGLLVAFPSFLGHSVRLHGGAATRISIAINVLADEAATR